MDDSARHRDMIIQGGQGYGLGRPSANVNPALPLEPVTPEPRCVPPPVAAVGYGGFGVTPPPSIH